MATPREAPPTGGWTAFPPLAHPRFDPSYGGRADGMRLRVLALSDGRVLVCGGHVVNLARARKSGGKHWLGVPVKESEIWDGEAWRTIPGPMAEELAEGGRAPGPPPKLAWEGLSNAGWSAERRSATLVPLDAGEVLIAGGALVWSTWDGDDTEDCVKSTVLFSKKKWQYAGDVSQGRKHGAATRLADGRVMFVGGQSTNYEAFANVDVWEPMAPEQAVAHWSRNEIAQAHASNGKYPTLLARALQEARGKVLTWGEWGTIFDDALEAFRKQTS